MFVWWQEPGSTQTGLDKGRKGSTKNAESRSIGAVASTLSSGSSNSGGKSPGTGTIGNNGNADKNNRSGESANVSNGTTNRPEGNPFEEEEWDEYPNEALVDNGEPGVPVKALYDYEGAEFDELSFKKGTSYFCFFLLVRFLLLGFGWIEFHPFVFCFA